MVRGVTQKRPILRLSMRGAMPPVRPKKQPVAQGKEHRRYDYRSARICCCGPHQAAEPPVHRLIERALVAEIRGPEWLPATLEARRSKRDADDAVGQAQSAPRDQ